MYLQAMAQKSHLEQEELDSRAKPILAELGRLLNTLEFEEQGDFEFCSVDPQTVQPKLLAALFAIIKVVGFLLCNTCN